MHPHPSPDESRPGQTRREFIRRSLAAGAAAAALPYLASETGCTAAGPPGAAVPPFELDEATIASLADDMRAGRRTARSIAEAYIGRIRAVDRSGPALGSVIELNPDALDIADALDRERREKGERGPLHGIPILIKDNIDTADRMETTAGSLALAGSRPPSDAFIAGRLRRAGAVILGKTNLSEWANIRSTHSTSGWSARGGLTRNPYALDRNTSGSSSGSAVAAAANLCAAAVGTETDGSIVSPSSVNGIVGIKPTVGLVSRTGIIPISHTQDTAGPMARTVRDAAILLGALAGADPEDPATAGAGEHAAPDYTKFLDPEGLRGARIGIVRNYFGFLGSVDAVAEEAIALLRGRGAVIIDPLRIDSLGGIGDAEMTVLLYELKADMKAYLGRRGEAAGVRTLADIISFNEKNRGREMPWFGQELFLRAEAKGPLTDRAYLEALGTCRRLAATEGIDAAMEKDNLDALMAPTDCPAWPTDLIGGDHYIGGSSSGAAVARYPSITVPAGEVFGLPVGISFFGKAWSEPALIGIAYAYEQATRHRKPPRFLPSVEFPAA